MLSTPLSALYRHKGAFTYPAGNKWDVVIFMRIWYFSTQDMWSGDGRDIESSHPQSNLPPGSTFTRLL